MRVKQVVWQANKMGICTLLVFWFFGKGSYYWPDLSCIFYFFVVSFWWIITKFQLQKQKSNFVVHSLFFVGKIFAIFWENNILGEKKWSHFNTLLRQFVLVNFMQFWQFSTKLLSIVAKSCLWWWLTMNATS